MWSRSSTSPLATLGNPFHDRHHHSGTGYIDYPQVRQLHKRGNIVDAHMGGAVNTGVNVASGREQCNIQLMALGQPAVTFGN